MRRPTGRGYCSACNVSAGSAHRSTRSHQDRVFRLNHPRVKLERAKRRQYAEQYSLKGKVRVRKHRRRPPLDGNVKTVHVKRYWRDEPYVSGGRAHRTRRRRKPR